MEMAGTASRTALVIVGIALASALRAEAQERPRIEESYAEHTRAVELGRAGRYAESLAILKGLRARFPDDYALHRDYMVIAAWAGECGTALAEFQSLDGRRLEGYVISPLRECAVRQAREGRTEDALAILKQLEKSAPGDVALRSDLVIVTIWTGDCDEAIARFERFGSADPVEPYVVTAVTNCLLKARRTQEALTLSRTMSARFPDDAPLRQAYLRSEVAWRLKGKGENEWWEIDARLGHQQPERGVREWVAEATVSAPLARGLRGYVRYLDSRGNDTALVPGELRRLAAGLRYAPAERWSFGAEVSDDIRDAGAAGHAVSVNYRPFEQVEYWVSYASFATDSPLRARAVGIYADASQAGFAAQSLDYRWEGRLVIGRYDFTDGNLRKNVYANLGYAYEMLASREQRVFVEWYESSNSLAGTVYFNPSEDRSVGLMHRTTFVYDSVYKRHADHLQVWVNNYQQLGYDTDQRWGIRFEQDYDFDERNAFVWGVGWARNVYDGQPEREIRVDARYRWRF